MIIVSDAAATTTLPATFAKIAGFSGAPRRRGPCRHYRHGEHGGVGDQRDHLFTGAAGAVTINNAVAGLTVDFHGNNGGFDERSTAQQLARTP